MLIENKIVFIKIPKNASSSIYKSLILNDFNVDEGHPYVTLERNKSINLWKLQNQPLSLDNYHQTYNELNSFFPHKQYQYVGIKRDSTDRFISAWKYMIMKFSEYPNIYPSYTNSTVDFSKFTTNEVIEFFKPIAIKMYSVNAGEVVGVIKEFFSSNTDEISNSGFPQIIRNFQSQYYWGLGKCDLIFNYEELNLFEKYIGDVFNKDFNLLHINDTQKIDIKLEKTKELVEFVEKYIDSPFTIKKML